jgi:hypothetical protein
MSGQAKFNQDVNVIGSLLINGAAISSSISGDFVAGSELISGTLIEIDTTGGNYTFNHSEISVASGSPGPGLSGPFYVSSILHDNYGHLDTISNGQLGDMAEQETSDYLTATETEALVNNISGGDLTVQDLYVIGNNITNAYPEGLSPSSDFTITSTNNLILEASNYVTIPSTDLLIGNSGTLILSEDNGIAWGLVPPPGSYIDSRSITFDDVGINLIKATSDNGGNRIEIPSNVSVSGDLTILGDFIVSGTEYIVYSESVSASDNLIVINAGEVGSGVTKGAAGIRVDRGSATDYGFMFDEVRDAFVIGLMTDETSGTIATLQAVATRDDSSNMVDSTIPYWDDGTKSFKTDRDLTIDSSGNVTVSGILNLEDSISQLAATKSNLFVCDNFNTNCNAMSLATESLTVAKTVPGTLSTTIKNNSNGNSYKTLLEILNSSSNGISLQTYATANTSTLWGNNLAGTGHVLSSNDMIFQSTATEIFRFGGGASEFMNISSTEVNINGNLDVTGITTITTNSGSNLVLDKVSGASIQINGATGTTNPIILQATNDTNPNLEFFAGGASRFSVNSDNSVTVAGTLATDTLASKSGGVIAINNQTRIINNTSYGALNAAGTATVDLIKLNASDEVDIASGGEPTVIGGVLTVDGDISFGSATLADRYDTILYPDELISGTNYKGYIIGDDGSFAGLSLAHDHHITLAVGDLDAAGILYSKRIMHLNTTRVEVTKNISFDDYDKGVFWDSATDFGNGIFYPSAGNCSIRVGSDSTDAIAINATTATVNRDVNVNGDLTIKNRSISDYDNDNLIVYGSNYELTDVDQWVAYDDGSSTNPVDGTGGTPTGISLLSSDSSPIKGTRSYILTKSAGDFRGEGYSLEFSVDSYYQTKNMLLSFEAVVSVDSIFSVSLFDVTNGAIINDSIVTIFASKDRYQKQISIPNGCTQIRLCLHIASTSGTSTTCQIDNIRLSHATKDTIFFDHKGNSLAEIIGAQAIRRGQEANLGNYDKIWGHYLLKYTGGNYNTFIGTWGLLNGNRNTVVGYSNESGSSTYNNNSATIMGKYNYIAGPRNVAIGIGHNVDQYCTDNFAIGRYCSLTNSDNNILIGRYVGYSSGNDDCIFIGRGIYSNNSVDRSICIGKYSTPQQSDSIGIGYNTLVSGSKGIAIGKAAQATASIAIAIGASDYVGSETQANGIASISIGYQSVANAQEAISIGRESDATQTGNIAIGAFAQSTGSDNAVSIGRNSDATNSASVAIGRNAYATGNTSVAIGGSLYSGRTTASSSAAVAIGSDVAARIEGTLATRTPIIRKDLSETNKFESFGSSQNVIATQEINVTATSANNTITIPSGAVFLLEEVKMVVTSALDSTFDFSIGIVGNDTKYINTQTTGATVTGAYDSESFTSFLSSDPLDQTQTLRVTIDTATTSTGAVRFMIKGILLERE